MRYLIIRTSQEVEFQGESTVLRAEFITLKLVDHFIQFAIEASQQLILPLQQVRSVEVLIEL